MNGLEDYIKEWEKISKRAKEIDATVCKFKTKSDFGNSWLAYIPVRLLNEKILSKNKELSEYIFNNYLCKQFKEYKFDNFQKDIIDNEFKIDEFMEPNYNEELSIKKLKELYEKGFVQIRYDSSDID